MTVTEYCGKIKALADTLRDVGSPLTDQELVINLLSGMNDKFAHCIPTISASRPPMKFLQARSFLLQEEVWAANQAQKAASTALLAASRSAGASNNAPAVGSRNSSPAPAGDNAGISDRQRKHKKQAIRTGGTSGGQQPGMPPAATRGAPMASWFNPWTGVVQAWPLGQLPNNPPTAGVLGSRPDSAPQQSMTAQHAPASALPPALYEALTGLTLQSTPPSATNWLFDTGASSHMAGNSGMLSSTAPSSSRIIVGNGASLPVQCAGTATIPTSSTPLLLRDVLVSPPLIKNLISVRRLTRDNSVSIEFDPFGISIKDLHSKTVLLRSDSTGDLYPRRSPVAASASHCFHVSVNLWHGRLGHPGRPALSSILNSFDFACEPTRNHSCTACRIGKHV
jgi:hypothetical protein